MAKNIEVPFDDIFAETDTLEEALEARKIILKHCPWPLIYELEDGRFGVGGMTKSGGRLKDPVVEKIAIDLHEFAKKENVKDIDPEKFKNTIKELENL